MTEQTQSKFAISRGKGFHMTFPTGWTISVQFGYGNYCDNRDIGFGAETPPSSDAEIAVWPEGGDMIRLGYCDDVVGWVDTTTVGKLIGYLANGGTDPEEMQRIANNETAEEEAVEDEADEAEEAVEEEAVALPEFEETKTLEHVDRSTWGEGPWDAEPHDYATWYDEETGLPCLVLRGPVGSWCGYVGFPEGHPLHGVDYDAVTYWGVHGGFTFGRHCVGHICHTPRRGEGHVYWLGFDTAHSGDLSPGMPMYRSGEYRTLEYVVAECIKVAGALGDHDAAKGFVYASSNDWEPDERDWNQPGETFDGYEPPDRPWNEEG